MSGEHPEIKGSEALTGQPCGELARAHSEKTYAAEGTERRMMLARRQGLARWGPTATLSTGDLTRWGMRSHSRPKTLQGSSSNYRL